MKNFGRIITLSSYVAMACSGMLMSTGCETSGEDHVDTLQAAVEVRFQDAVQVKPPPISGMLRSASRALVSTTHDTVARVLVDITFADTSLRFRTQFELAKFGPDVWRGDIPLLPRNKPLRFAARALDASGGVIFSGEALATLTVDNQRLQISLAPAQNNRNFQVLRIVYSAEMFAGQEEQVIFTIEGNAGLAIGIQITAIGSSTMPSTEFSPASGTVILTNTAADFSVVYTPPEVTVDTDFDYQVTITDTRAQNAGAITTNFRTHIKPRPPGGAIVHGTRPSVRFNPVILSLTVNGSEIPGVVELVATVSNNSAPDKLAFQWSYTPSAGTPDATFANDGQGNPGYFEGYTGVHQGTITLVVTDEQNGTTTLHYQLAADQFADAIDHTSISGLKAPGQAAPTPGKLPTGVRSGEMTATAQGSHVEAIPRHQVPGHPDSGRISCRQCSESSRSPM